MAVYMCLFVFNMMIVFDHSVNWIAEKGIVPDFVLCQIYICYVIVIQTMFTIYIFSIHFG